MFYGHFSSHGRINGERCTKAMKRSQRLNTLQICPRIDLNSGDSGPVVQALPVRPLRRPARWRENSEYLPIH